MSSAFTSKPGSTQTMSVTQSSSSISIDDTCNSIRVYNAGPSLCFIRKGRGSTTATTSNMPVPPGIVEVFGTNKADTVAAICASGLTTTLYVTQGTGD